MLILGTDCEDMLRRRHRTMIVHEGQFMLHRQGFGGQRHCAWHTDVQLRVGEGRMQRSVNATGQARQGQHAAGELGLEGAEGTRRDRSASC